MYALFFMRFVGCTIDFFYVFSNRMSVMTAKEMVFPRSAFGIHIHKDAIYLQASCKHSLGDVMRWFLLRILLLNSSCIYNRINPYEME